MFLSLSRRTDIVANCLSIQKAQTEGQTRISGQSVGVEGYVTGQPRAHSEISSLKNNNNSKYIQFEHLFLSYVLYSNLVPGKTFNPLRWSIVPKNMKILLIYSISNHYYHLNFSEKLIISVAQKNK